MSLYGPMSVMLHDGTGALTAISAPGVHYTTDEGYFAANPVLAQYRAEPVHPLQSVMAGDDPAAPAWTVPICFPDQATADAVLTQIESP